MIIHSFALVYFMRNIGGTKKLPAGWRGGSLEEINVFSFCAWWLACLFPSRLLKGFFQQISGWCTPRCRHDGTGFSF